MRNHRFQNVDAMVGSAHWPDELALDAAELHRAGAIAESEVRLVDMFLRHLRARGAAIAEVAAADFQTFGSLSQIERLVRALGKLDPALARAARPALCDLRSARWARRKPPEDAPDVRQTARTLSLPDDAWPAAWRRAVERLRRRAASVRTNVVAAEDGAVHSAHVVGNLANTVGQLAALHREHDLGDRISLETVDLFVDAMARRQLRPATKALRLKELTIFAREVGADCDVERYVKPLINAFARETDRTRSRKEQTLLQLGLSLGDIFERARELHRLAAEAPSHHDTALHARLDAALIGLSVNAPLRCGDLHRLRVGVELVRDAEGWRLAVEQRKTGQSYRLDRLWDEVGGFLDALVLDGRDASALRERLAVLDGCGLFSVDDGVTAVDVGWPTKVWRRHFGVGAHIVRSLWATYYAETDPTQAWMASALLGHRGACSRKAYEVEVRRTRAVAVTQAMIDGLLPSA